MLAIGGRASLRHRTSPLRVRIPRRYCILWLSPVPPPGLLQRQQAGTGAATALPHATFQQRDNILLRLICLCLNAGPLWACRAGLFDAQPDCAATWQEAQSQTSRPDSNALATGAIRRGFRDAALPGHGAFASRMTRRVIACRRFRGMAACVARQKPACGRKARIALTLSRIWRQAIENKLQISYISGTAPEGRSSFTQR